MFGANKEKEEFLRTEELNLKFAKMEAELSRKYMEKQLAFEIRCAENKRKGEHDYHKEMEDRRVVLAKLNAEVEFKQKLLAEKDSALKGKDDLLAAKDKMIEMLNELLKKKDNVIVAPNCCTKESK